MRRIGVVVFNGLLALDAIGPCDVFAMANRMGKGAPAPYEVEVLSLCGGPVLSSSGVSLNTVRLEDAASPFDTLMVVGGRGVEDRTADDELVQWVRQNAPACRRICSVCTGAFILAAAGVLAGRRAVTHWDSGVEFSTRFPEVVLDLSPIYIHDGPVWTSAGVTAGIDLALALVEEDLGRGAALTIAKQLVVFLHRPGGQAQFSTPLTAQVRALKLEPEHRFCELNAWIADNLRADLSVTALARQANMSSRSFARAYLQVMGITPAKAVEQFRVEAAKQALERREQSIKRIAATCGFGDDERLRRAFLRHLGVAPDAYRDRFAALRSATDVRAPV